MKSAIVVGANGFLGTALVDKLIQLEIDVWAVYNNRHENINEKAKKITTDAILELNIQPEKIFFVTGNYSNTHQELLKINDTLYKYTQRFKKSKIIFISSTNVYGYQDSIINEDSSFNNPNIYAHSKIAGEFIVKSIERFAIARLTYIYGAGITNNSFIPQIIKSAKETGTIQLFGDGNRKQDYIYIDDAVDFCIQIANIEENRTYLGATGISVTNKEVAEEIAKYINCEIQYKGEDSGQSFVFNPKNSHDFLKWTPKVSLSEGIRNMTAQ